jgi:hypothetical protein
MLEGGGRRGPPPCLACGLGWAARPRSRRLRGRHSVLTNSGKYCRPTSPSVSPVPVISHVGGAPPPRRGLLIPDVARRGTSICMAHSHAGTNRGLSLGDRWQYVPRPVQTGAHREPDAGQGDAPVNSETPGRRHVRARQSHTDEQTRDRRCLLGQDWLLRASLGGAPSHGGATLTCEARGCGHAR